MAAPKSNDPSSPQGIQQKFETLHRILINGIFQPSYKVTNNQVVAVFESGVNGDLVDVLPLIDDLNRWKQTGNLSDFTDDRASVQVVNTYCKIVQNKKKSVEKKKSEESQQKPVKLVRKIRVKPRARKGLNFPRRVLEPIVEQEETEKDCSDIMPSPLDPI